MIDKTPPNDPWLTVQEVATHLGISKTTARKLMRDGSISSERIPGTSLSSLRPPHRSRLSAVVAYERKNIEFNGNGSSH